MFPYRLCTLCVHVFLFLLPSSVQLYYPNFLESGVYLKFLDHLIHMVKVTPEQESLNVAENNMQHAPSNDSSGQTELKALRYLAWDVDDPESLWRRPHLL